MRRQFPLGFLVLCILNCQDYPFEQRLPLRSAGHTVSQNVATVTPTDILFVIDNSGSMKAQRAELNNNMAAFIQSMAASQDSFHVGIITTDVDCNLPGRAASCTAGDGAFTNQCCGLRTAAAPPLVDCQDQKLAGSANINFSTCDGGRLRSISGLPAYFTPPATAADQNQWASNVEQVISNLGCNGSGFESGFEAARRAIACSMNLPECPDPNIAQLNAGFIRDKADLAIIFVSDEDDCSFQNPNTYQVPSNIYDPNMQGSHLCAPEECYAYYDRNAVDSNGLQLWASNYYQCTQPASAGGASTQRIANPPYPDDPNTYLDFFIAAKGNDVSKFRAAGVISAMASTSSPLGFVADACVNPAGAGPTNGCGCWSASSSVAAGGQFYCALTQVIGHSNVAYPPTATSNECSSLGSGSASPPPGCKAMPAGRYANFLQSLSNRRTAALLNSDTLVDTICNASYSNTMFEIVNTIILTSCFQLSEVPPNVGSIVVQLNGKTLSNVPVGSKTQGWSWVPGSSQICLQGGLKKTIGDTFNIFILDAVTTPN